MKNTVLLILLAITFTSCEEESKPLPKELTKIEGAWENYRVEKHELVGVDFSNGTAIFEKQWFDQTSQFSTRNTLEFNEDYTFTNLYAGVNTGHNGMWSKINDRTFSLTFNNPLNTWSELTDTYIVNFYCDNTMSIEYLVAPPAGNHGFENFYIKVYFRTPETSECSEQIDYYVSN